MTKTTENTISCILKNIVIGYAVHFKWKIWSGALLLDSYASVAYYLLQYTNIKNSTHAVIYINLSSVYYVPLCLVLVVGGIREPLVRTRVQGCNDDDGPQLFRLHIFIYNSILGHGQPIYFGAAGGTAL